MATDSRAREIVAHAKEHIADEAHASAVIAATGPYVLARERLLFKEMLNVLKYGVSSQRVEVAERWTNALEKAIEDMGKAVALIPTAQKKLPEALRTVETKIAADEAKFIQATGKLMGLGAKVDVIIKLGLDLTEKSKELEEVWDELADDMDDAEEEMDDAQKDIETTINDAIRSVAANQQTAYEHAMDVAEALEKLPPEANPLSLLDGLGAFARWMTSLRHTHAAQMKAKELVWGREGILSRQLAKRGVGVVMFAELRDAVKAFLDKVNVQASVDAVKAVREMCKDAEDGCVVPSQKADMAALTKELSELIEDAHDKMVSAHDRFVAANSGIFFGTVSNKTMKVLLNDERWKKARDKVRISQLNNALQKLYDFDYVTVPLRDYDGDRQSELKNYLRRSVGELYEDIEKAAKDLGMLPDKYEDFLDSMERLDREID
ncbi:MAG: hypothetical protein AAGD86_09440 [Pseudomonadota bacterium]